MPMKALVSLLVACAIGLAILIERTEYRSGAGVKAKELLVADLAGEPGKEVNIQVYTFPPGASVPWHIHPHAHEFDYELDGERRASRSEYEPHASSEDLPGAGEPKGSP